jgi:hypothetical protein
MPPGDSLVQKVSKFDPHLTELIRRNNLTSSRITSIWSKIVLRHHIFQFNEVFDVDSTLVSDLVKGSDKNTLITNII